MKTSVVLRICRATCVVLLVLFALMPLFYRQHLVFATSATVVVALTLLLIAFQIQRLRLLVRTIEKLNEPPELLRDATRRLSPTESKQIQQELEEIRARLLQDTSPESAEKLTSFVTK